MRRASRILLLAALLGGASLALPLPLQERASAASLQLTFGGVVRGWEDERVRAGVSLRARMKLYSEAQARGFFAHTELHGNVFASDYAVGYGIQSRGQTYFEGGAGARYSPIWGTGALLIAGFSHRVSDRFFLSFPVYYRTGGSDGFQFTPYLGIEF